MKRLKVMSVFGTRPEAIKMCPLIQKLEDCDEINSIVCVTGQHEEMLNQVIDIFHIRIDYNLHIMRPKQTLTTITVNILSKIEEIIQKENPDIILVHGDTTTSFVVGLAAFYQRIPVGHVEAGLRTFNKYSPFPEEMNRNLTGRIAELHFSPTISNSNNLIAEGILSNVFVTGNTVIDAFQTTVRRDYEFKDEVLRTIDFSKRKCILLTAHRRENFGEPLVNICNAVRRIAREQDVIVIYPVHLNPIVRDTANSILSEEENVYLINPIDVEDMHNLLARSYLVMTDSGGLQEEAPAFGVPVLVLRTETERPEAVEAGTVKVVGIGEDDIYENAKELLINSNSYEKMAKAVNPYGDGHAS
ncbi:MAG TPA: UDP-N-acetylglucosamine 2-epimerase (non-hydrolyzing), partial [Lachnospiraceae bacterium]|nr:UDP-N-acetylglucosamine 2-epimerase (non-hydrolyzing) [Lachnospiraceae bacterium]